jgi:PAS domain S-box-containing protein
MDSSTFQFLDVNQATVRTLGYSRAELLKRSFLDLRRDDDDEHVDEGVSAQDALTERHRLVTGHDGRDGEVIDVEISARPIRFEGRNALLTVMHDITEPTLAVALRDEFFSIAAHELKTPITVLRGQSQLNLRRLNRDTGMEREQVGAAFMTIDEQSRKLQRLVDQLLDVSRIESGRLTLERETADVAIIVRTAVASAQLRGGNRPIHLTSPEEVVARVDPLRLEQVLANLLDNALKYSPSAQPIEVSLSVRDNPLFQKGAGPSGHETSESPSVLRIEVRDYGRGIPVEDHERIFQRFQQVHANDQVKGFGLGLYVCRQIVELHGGVISVDSSTGNGTRFIVTLPIEAPVVAQARERPA